MSVCQSIMHDALIKEIIATIKDDETLDDEVLHNFINKKYEGIPANSIDIAISYDMGWNKRSTGRVYDSLSLQGFLIGCRTGKMIAMGVIKKVFDLSSSN